MEKIYLELYDILLFRAASIVGNREDARDIVQELYIRITGRECAAYNPRGYLYGMVSNMAREFLRNQTRRREIELHISASSPTWPTVPLNTVDDLLSPLTPLQRQIVRLHDIEGYSCVEVALRLMRTPVAVKKQLALAHGKMKTKIQQSGL